MSNANKLDVLYKQIQIQFQAMTKILILLVLSVWVQGLSLYNLITISNKTGAACLDGSAAGFYLWQPEDDDPSPKDKILIYFEQTPFGWCVKQDLSTSIEECYKFISEEYLSEFGSSDDWEEDMMFLGGMLSPLQGGELSNWIKVYIRSCDGGAYMGNRDPIAYKKSKLHFKGSVNTIEIFNYLKAKGYLEKKKQVVISGSYNGAMAAMQWVNTLQTYTSTQVKLHMDAGIYLNQPDYKKNTTLIQNQMIMVNKIFLNQQGGPNQQCNAANPQNPWKCFFAQQLYKYVKVPTFLTQSLYDGRAIQQILGFKCTVEFGSLSECQKKEREIIELYHDNVTKLARQITKKQGDGAFGIACVGHQFIGGKWLYDEFEVPMNSGNMAGTVMNEWIKTNKSMVFIDEMDWPENKPCAKKLVSLQSQ